MIIAGALGHGLARADSGVSVSVTSVDDSAFPKVTVTLSAEDAGLPITSATAADVQVQEGGKPATVESVTTGTTAQLPLALVIAIDTSGSVAGPTLASVKASAISLIQSLGPNDSAAVIGFADKVQVLQPLSTDKAALAAAVEKLSAGGNTALYDAIANSSATADSSGLARRAVVLMTDGEDSGQVSKLTAAQSLTTVTSGGTLFYVIGVGAQIDEQFLQSVATQSGGKFFSSPDASGISGIYASLEQLLRSQLIITFHSTAPASPGERAITVTLKQGEASGSTQRTYTSTQHAAVVTPPAPPPAVAPRVAAISVKQPGSSGIGRGTLLTIIGLVVAVLGAAVILLARRRSHHALRQRPPGVEEFDTAAVPTASPLAGEPVRKARFALEVRGLPTAAPLDGHPVTIGAGHACELRLPEAAGVAAAHARIWLRDGKPMLHHIARGYETAVNGEKADWASIGPRDTITIGPYAIKCIAFRDHESTAMQTEDSLT